jgi:hypothetical protein
MIFAQKASLGRVHLFPSGPFTTGERVTLTLTCVVGREGLNPGARVRFGLPNTGWEKPVVPQLRYWDELKSGSARAYAPFHPVNTTARVESKRKTSVSIQAMERMLLPDEDPAEAYWRWWVTATLEDGPLSCGDRIVICYGDPRFLEHAARVQTFPESGLTLSVYIDSGDGNWFRPSGAPIKLDVVAGKPSRVNVVRDSLVRGGATRIRIALTDECQCRPREPGPRQLAVRNLKGEVVVVARFKGMPVAQVLIKDKKAVLEPFTITDASAAKVWGQVNPSIAADGQNLNLYWGDLHAQSEYHVMHSQKKDAKQRGWIKGISCGKPDEVYQYARDTALLDFTAITDQGAITGVGWNILQQKAAEYYRPGKFVTFNAYEAGSPVGHRNVYFRDGGQIPAQTSGDFNFMPEFLFRFYAGRRDVMMIPHHVKTWTDWSFHDPDLEPVMEVYSCWGQSENPSLQLWDKGMTPGAGAWEALRRGYRLGMLASSDNHVGMPGRSYPHDRQVHTPFPGGLAAVWAAELSRESVFDAIRNRHCYGTTGARIVFQFEVNGRPMGAEIELEHRHSKRRIRIRARGTDAISTVEIIRSGTTVHTYSPTARRANDNVSMEWEDSSPALNGAFYYARLRQANGEMAWCSPVWVNLASTRRVLNRPANSK